MNINRISVAAVLLSAPIGFAVLPLSAQKASSQGPGKATSLKIGKVNIGFGGFLLIGNKLRCSSGVRMTSAQYDLTAEDVQAVFASRKSGHSGLTRATAEGSRAKKTQVSAHVKQPLQGDAFEIHADHAVYVPDYGRPDGGRIDFTGRVTALSTSGALAGPAPGDFGDGPVTILLGQGDDYPQLQTGRGNIVVTPAQQ